MVQEIITKVEQSIQCVLCYLLNLCFQPIYCLLQIIQGIISIWSGEEEPDEISEQPQYPEIPVVNGFHANANEQAEIDQIKKQLNQ